MLNLDLLKCDSFKCGSPAIKPLFKTYQSKILNGDIAVPNSWPWVVSLRYKRPNSVSFRNHICSGALISSRHILTTAQCVSDIQFEKLAILIGSNNLNDDLTLQNIYLPLKIIIHSKYNSQTLTNDIAIIILTRKVFFSYKISPICLPPSPQISLIFGKNIFVVGWYKDF